MLLSALMLNMALFGMVKWMIPIAPEALNQMKFLIISLGIIGVVYAGVIAIKQQDIKRIFAYASISHVGLITAGIMLFNTEALSAVFLQIANHSLVAIGLFLAAGILENRLNTRDLTEMGGIAKVAPKFAFWFAVTSFASMAVPFTSGFIGEFLILKGLFSYHWIVGILAGSTLVFGAIYTLRAYQLRMYGAPKTSAFEDLKWNELVAFVILSAVIVLLGIFPQIVLDFVGPSLDKIVTTIQTSKIQIK
jgi:NADH-quinone oxidoreductase subunit M